MADDFMIHIRLGKGAYDLMSSIPTFGASGKKTKSFLAWIGRYGLEVQRATEREREEREGKRGKRG